MQIIFIGRLQPRWELLEYWIWFQR